MMKISFLPCFAALSLLTRCDAGMFDLDWLLTTNKAISSNEVVDCEVRTAVFNGGNNNEHFIQRRCVSYADDQDETIYDLPQQIVDKYGERFESHPESYLHIDGGHFSKRISKGLRSNGGGIEIEDQIIVDKDARVQISDAPFQKKNSHHRRTAEKTGSSSVLVVRVTTNDAQVDQDAPTLSDYIFGSVGTPASQFESCSMGQKTLHPATGDAKISGGVIDLMVNANIAGKKATEFENTINVALVAAIGSLADYDHIMYCLPPGANGPSGLPGRWKAYAYVNWNRSVYNHNECTYLSTLVHEIGHNIGLGHSGEGDLAYGDQSGAMGYGYPQERLPLMCFNGAKNWQLGWYQEKAIELPDRAACGPWKGRLYGYPDFMAAPTNSNEVVLIKVGDLHLQFNKIAEMNRDSKERRDQIEITKSNSVVNSKSFALGGFSQGTWQHGRVRVDVCARTTVNGLEFFDIVIRDKDQESICDAAYTSTCDAATPSPTPAPTPEATKRPTPSPTNRPTVSRTAPPKPTPSPATAPPSGSPTMMPSNVPSDSPSTSVPTDAPSGSMSPSSSPTVNDICDDSLYGRFPFVNDEMETEMKSCSWLAARSGIQKRLCVPGHRAFDLCEETCGKCTDNCFDKDEYFKFKNVDRPCSWLAIRANVIEEVCGDSTHPAYSVCPETCGVCDTPGSLLPGKNFTMP